MKKFKVLVSLGRTVVENTHMNIEAKDQEHAEELATQKAKDYYDSYFWKHCGDYDCNYQVDEIQEIKNL